MVVLYKKSRLTFYKVMILFWMSLAILNLLFNESTSWSFYLMLIISIFSVVSYLYSFFNHYLTIENGILKQNQPYGKRINLKEIKTIKKFAGDYTLKTEQKELKINTELIDKDALSELNKILTELNLPPEKTPFANNV